MEKQRPGLLAGEKIIKLQGSGAAAFPHLCDSWGPREFLTRREAIRAAARLNGIPYMNKRRMWLVRFEF
jgi:hypothetical protein